jgi:hypothetical protein
MSERGICRNDLDHALVEQAEVHGPNAPKSPLR